MKIKTKHDRRHRIHLRQRKRIAGTEERPRLSVFRSVSHIYAQVIDDMTGRTLVAASSLDGFDSVPETPDEKKQEERAPDKGKQEKEKPAKADKQAKVGEAKAAPVKPRAPQTPRGGNLRGAEAVGRAIAKRSLEQGIKRVVFDRSGFLYHGRIKAVADAARKGGLEF